MHKFSRPEFLMECRGKIRAGTDQSEILKVIFLFLNVMNSNQLFIYSCSTRKNIFAVLDLLRSCNETGKCIY